MKFNNSGSTLKKNHRDKIGEKSRKETEGNKELSIKNLITNKCWWEYLKWCDFLTWLELSSLVPTIILQFVSFYPGILFACLLSERARVREKSKIMGVTCYLFDRQKIHCKQAKCWIELILWVNWWLYTACLV